MGTNDLPIGSQARIVADSCLKDYVVTVLGCNDNFVRCEIILFDKPAVVDLQPYALAPVDPATCC
jgi:hypothetical protein